MKLLTRNAAAALLLAAAAPSVARAQPACPDVLPDSVAIDPHATLHYAVAPSDPPDAANGLFCARLEVNHDAWTLTGLEGWIGLAISADGKMPGSTGVIGVPGGIGLVRKYDLYQYGVKQMPDSNQTLVDASVDADYTEDKTTLSFAKLLVEEGEVPIVVPGTNTFLHARGGLAIGYHGANDRFVFELDLSFPPAAGAGNSTGEPGAGPNSDSPTGKPTVASVEMTGSPSKEGTVAPVVASPPTTTPTPQPVVAATANPTTTPSTPAATAPSPDSSAGAKFATLGVISSLWTVVVFWW